MNLGDNIQATIIPPVVNMVSRETETVQSNGKDFHLKFAGTCLRAFEFYEAVFFGKIASVIYYRDCMISEVEDLSEDKIFNILLEADNGNRLFGCDLPEKLISLNPKQVVRFHSDSEGEFLHLFYRLSARGKVIRPIEEDRRRNFKASCVDHFGIQWELLFMEEI